MLPLASSLRERPRRAGPRFRVTALRPALLIRDPPARCPFRTLSLCSPVQPHDILPSTWSLWVGYQGGVREGSGRGQGAPVSGLARLLRPALLSSMHEKKMAGAPPEPLIGLPISIWVSSHILKPVPPLQSLPKSASNSDNSSRDRWRPRGQ